MTPRFGAMIRFEKRSLSLEWTIELLPRNRIANEEALALIEKLSTMPLMLMTSAATIFRLRKYERRGTVWKTVQGQTTLSGHCRSRCIIYAPSVPLLVLPTEEKSARGAFPCPKVVEQ